MTADLEFSNFIGYEMGTTGNNNFQINFKCVIDLIKRSPFFITLDNDPREDKIKHYILKEINIKHINLPQRLRFFANKNNISTLADLLELEPKPILRSRNLGKRSIVKAKRIILSYLCENEDCLEALCKKIDAPDSHYSTFILEKYFPFLQGIYKTTEFYYHFVTKDVSYIKIPVRIKDYIKCNPHISTLEDILNIRYDDLIRIDNIGRKTIKSLQCTLIDLLCLEKVASVPREKF